MKTTQQPMLVCAHRDYTFRCNDRPRTSFHNSTGDGEFLVESKGRQFYCSYCLIEVAALCIFFHGQSATTLLQEVSNETLVAVKNELIKCFPTQWAVYDAEFDRMYDLAHGGIAEIDALLVLAK